MKSPFLHFLSLFFVILLLFASSCSLNTKNNSEEKLFTLVNPKDSGVDFINRIEESENFHYYNYIYTYNGGGVATGDLNNDNLPDIVFTSTQRGIRIYRNLGNLKFKDITASGGIKNPDGFYSGVTLVDINQDGFLDIYVCRSGWYKEDHMLSNLLFTNNGDLTFSENARQHGLADSNRSITSVFFDYDKDGDLDAYISNSPVVTRDFRNIRLLDSLRIDPETVTLKGSDKLYNNDGNGIFSDVSEQSGIYPERGFALNAMVGDLNGDDWMDIYVSNDFEIPDFAFINNQNGTFTERRSELVNHTSFYSMGSDLADINNDGLYDLMVLDMIPEDHVRSKTTMAATTFDKHQQMVNKGYGYQYMHNVLQLNNGNGTFSEISYLAGITNTDWSWSPLIADFDLDGYNDIYITNGVFRDVIDQDVTKSIISIMKKNKRNPTNADFLSYTKMLHQQKMVNYFFKNTGDLSFENYSSRWVNPTPTFSNGSSYVDLDNDGDLDIVINNLDEEATILKNNAIELSDNHFLEIKFSGSLGNLNGIGAIVNLFFEDGSRQTRQLIKSRGYLSSVSDILHFGLGRQTEIQKVEVQWPDGKIQNFKNLNADTLLIVNYSKSTQVEKTIETLYSNEQLFTKRGFNGKHSELEFDDYQIQALLPHKLSQTGPGTASADVNNDGIDDIFIGGSHQFPGELHIGTMTGSYKLLVNEAFQSDRNYEDVGACFFDSDNDGDMDLYVVSGSYEFMEGSEALQDRLYLNSGNGVFKKSQSALPRINSAGSVVVSSDFNNDGNIDLFVGGRVIPGAYPHPPTSYILINSNGQFSIGTESMASELQNAGMVTCAEWNDIDMDGDIDLVVAGEWMGIEVFENESGTMSKSNSFEKLSELVGWWNEIKIADVNNDGMKDIIAGNLGLNYKFRASREQPFHLFVSDFDFNGIEEIILAEHKEGRLVPVKSRSPLVRQIPHLANKIASNMEFASRDLNEIIGPRLESAIHYQAIEFRSGIFYGKNDQKYAFVPFENQVQMSPINSIIYHDFDGDDFKDLLLAGNNYLSEFEITKADAGTGYFLKGFGNGSFNFLQNLESGFFCNRDTRDILLIRAPKRTQVVVVNNNSSHDLFDINN
ncbi:MAG: VCBS repeat-containing protein [Cytophagales bacterium]|nr:VCBS repeat-containing protein [Cytophagales bacterium]